MGLYEFFEIDISLNQPVNHAIYCVLFRNRLPVFFTEEKLYPARSSRI